MNNPQQTYERRCAEFGRQRDEYARRSARLSSLRLGLFLAALALGLLAVVHSPWWWLGVAGLGLAFVVAVAQHHEVERTRSRNADLATLNEHGLARLRRDWAHLPLNEPAEPAPTNSYANDLDVFGHASLLHLIGGAVTPIGLGVLRGWLLQPAPPTIITERQAAVRELAPMLEFRDAMALRGRAASGAKTSFEQFLRWAEGDTSFPPAWLVWTARIMPVLTIGAFVAYFAGWTVVPWWLVLVVVNLLIISSVGQRGDGIIGQVSARQNAYRAYADLFGLVATQSWTSPKLRDLHTSLAADGLRADQQMARLNRIMGFAEQRFSFFYIALQAFTLWSIHVAWALQRWQRDVGPHVRRWMTTLGEIEALSALAVLHHDQPDWVLPQIGTSAAPRVWGENIGHPLLPTERARTNDAAIGPPQTFLLVTGSNMSGKSTLLRAVGLNVVLAQAGGPVCATTFHLPPLTLATSMRINDSLEGGVSYFMAELLRLKWVVDVAEQTQRDGERMTLFLLDEILHGTNTSERQIAARQIIQHLLAIGAIGAVSTHDLTLAAAPDIAASSQPFYFTEQFSRGPDGPVMEFDYTLRPGLAPSTNALKLMEIVGLPLEVGRSKA